MKITVNDLENGWVKGECNGYTYCAKVYLEPSCYGINNGRVSKLEIRDCNDTIVVYYERGWDIKPSGKHTKVYNKVYETMENLYR